MNSSTHSAILIDESGRAVAFIDGIPDKCSHVWDGEGLHFNNDGEYFRDSEMPDKTLNNGRDLHEFHILHQITGGTCTCSKCGNPYEPDIFADEF